ncbi:MAG TPA: alkaline phosphatase family protein [Candidatus Bathyarchaeia archaeon]|nr:alkaline phosphatase family protein [Candidatus Bathyarchaeia archaeon]
MHRTFRCLAAVAVVVTCLVADYAQASTAKRRTENVILITTDGLRWQEVFTGADPELMNKRNGGVADTNALAKEFWRDTPEVRREALMPFFWTVMAKQGQVFGNQRKGSVARITNTRKFSYPGYNEILTGFANPAINSNAKIPNETPTVLEWLHKQPGFRGAVAAFSAWDVMPFIINRERCGFPVMGGWEPVPEQSPTPSQALLNNLIRDTTRPNEAELSDSFLFQAALQHMQRHHPRVLFVSFLETDHWGHEGRYDRLLHSAHQVDNYVRRLWEAAQAIRQYRDRTTFVLVTDHGRGSAPEDWKHHGAKIEGAENIWMAFLGPDTPPLGERSDCEVVTQSQIAATLAGFLGKDYAAQAPQAGKPVRGVLPSNGK